MNRRSVAMVLLFLLFSCAGVKPIQEKEEANSPDHEEKEHTVIKDVLKSPPYQMNFTIRPGEVRFVKIPRSLLKEQSEIRCRDKKVNYYMIDQTWAGLYVAESYFSKMDSFQCFLRSSGSDSNQSILRFQVVEKKFPSERLNVDKRRVTLNKKDQERVKKEQKFLNANYRSSPDRPLFSKPFLVPLKSKITSIYGSRRVFNGNKKTQHLGTDFRAAVGKPIHAANSGKVVVARELFYSGNTVTIDHGLGIFTIYGHLSRVRVVEGEYIPQGTLLGFAGATGRVTGPHLHWGVKVNHHWVDGFSLVEESKGWAALGD